MTPTQQKDMAYRLANELRENANMSIHERAAEQHGASKCNKN